MTHTFVKIESYQDGCTIFSHLLLKARQSYRKTLDCSITPVFVNDNFGYTEVYDFSNNPLTAGLTITCGAMPRKNQKRIDAAQEVLNGLAPTIAELWNKRDFDGIKSLFS